MSVVSFDVLLAEMKHDPDLPQHVKRKTAVSMRRFPLCARSQSPNSLNYSPSTSEAPV